MSESGHRTDLPDEQQQALRRAVRLEWWSIAYIAVAITLVGLVLGNSQAMRTAWIEDMLSVIPQIAFLVALRFIRRRPTQKHPYGMQRSMSVGHLVASVALLSVGAVLAYESATSLINAEHPTIGTVEVFGATIWLGWLMIGVMVVISVPPFILGRLKLKVAKELHNKLLYADADMAKADWMTHLATIVGVAGVGIGLWWLDSAAALFISLSILWDGLGNTRAAVMDLMDERATTYDEKKPHPLISDAEDELRKLPWVRAAACRVRDEGQVFHVEAFVVPRSPNVSVDEVSEATKRVRDIDWKLQDVVVVVVDSLPEMLEPASQR